MFLLKDTLLVIYEQRDGLIVAKSKQEEARQWQYNSNIGHNFLHIIHWQLTPYPFL